MHHGSPGRQLLGQVTALINEVVSIDLNLTDEPGALSSAAMSGPAIQEMLDRAITLLDETEARYQGEAAAPGPQRPYRPARSPDLTQTMAGEICDLAHLASHELDTCRSRLQVAITEGNPLKVVATSGEAQRRLSNGLLHMEEALATFEGIEAPARVLWDLEISLEIRKRYAELRLQLASGSPPEGQELRPRLADFAERFSNLRASPIYRFLRFEDRIQLKSLLQGIRAWLTEEEQDIPDWLRTGRELWEDLQGLVELLRLINNRHELREHDRTVLASLCRELLGPAQASAPVPAHLRPELESLLGLDSELDHLIRDRPDAPVSDWQPCLQRLQQS